MLQLKNTHGGRAVTASDSKQAKDSEITRKNSNTDNIYRRRATVGIGINRKQCVRIKTSVPQDRKL